MVHADYLFLLTDVDGLYSANPRKDPDAKFLEVVSSVAEARLEGEEQIASFSSSRLPVYLFPVLIPPSPPSVPSFCSPQIRRILLTVGPTLHLLTH